LQALVQLNNGARTDDRFIRAKQIYSTGLIVAVCKTRRTQRAQTSADPEDPDFGLWTPGSEA